MTSLVDELKAALWSPTPVLSWLVVTVLVSFSGPFGTYEGFPFLHRLVYWAIVVAISIVAGATVRVVLRRTFRSLGDWGLTLANAVVMSLVLTVPVMLFTNAISAGTDGKNIPSPGEIMFLIFIVAVGVGALRSLLSQPPPPAGPRLMQRVEPEMRGRVIRLAVFDHYVSLITEKGETRLLMRFCDAIAELPPVEGVQVHRSHWVAVDAVQERLCEKGRLFLKTDDGALVPVSRNFRPEVERLFPKQRANS